jgi:hypothetical protein
MQLLHPETERVVFLHVPKCGGTTLHNLLLNWYGAENAHPERHNGLYGHPASSMAGYVLFSGHYDFFSTQLIPAKNKKTILLLRDPIERLISQYNYMRSHSIEFIVENNGLFVYHIHKFTINQYFFDPEVGADQIYDNVMARQLSSCPMVDYSIPYGGLMQNDLEALTEQALKNIETFDYVGVQENLDKAIKDIAVLLNKPIPEQIERLNSFDTNPIGQSAFRTIKKQRPNQATMKRLQELTRYDRIIYDRALELQKTKFA